MFIFPVLSCLVLFSKASEDLHPALKMTEPEIAAAFERGFKESAKLKDSTEALNRTRRGIGNIKISVIREETVSWLWCWHPRQIAYVSGMEAKRKYLSPDELEQQRSILKSPEITSPKTLDVFGVLGIYPSFGRANRRISRRADPNDLSEVRVVLQVGDRTYYPQSQPGALEYDEGHDTNIVTIPQYETYRSTSHVSGSVSGGAGISYFSGSATTTTVRTYTKVIGEGYDWYRGQFSAKFDLYEKDGTPRIRPSDKEFTVIVLYGPNERKATYKLDEWEKLFK